MSKRHFEAIARAFVQARQDVWNSHSYEQWKSCRDCVAATLKAINPRFDVEAFNKACAEEF